jgi:hypothetical protein
MILYSEYTFQRKLDVWDRQHYNNDPAMYGRVVALARLRPMPAGHTIHNYQSTCMELIRNRLQDRWPIGWPIDPVFYSPYGGPVLRHAVQIAEGIYDYGNGFAYQFTHGMVSLRTRPSLRGHLITEVRHQVSRDPSSAGIGRDRAWR